VTSDDTAHESTAADPLASITGLLASLGELLPLLEPQAALHTARRGVEAGVGALELLVSSLDNLNRAASRVNRLMDDIEEPLRQVMPHVGSAATALSKLGDSVGVLNDLARRLGPLGALLGQPASGSSDRES
jgi:ABC-type transporter Mla subunit MlaD